MLVFKGKLAAEDAAVFLKAMDAVLKKLPEEESTSLQTEQLITGKQQDAAENVSADIVIFLRILANLITHSGFIRSPGLPSTMML
ncbi:MAG: hypothetical protein O2971_19540 [Proteobacteria bacterium]|nr:hypothetical protein [Pseudomonadota bacterium]